MQGVYSSLTNAAAGAVDFLGRTYMRKSRADLGSSRDRRPWAEAAWPVCGMQRCLQPHPGCKLSPREHQWQKKKHVSFLHSSHGICICQVLHCIRQIASYKTDGWLHKKPLIHHAACHIQSNKPKETLNHVWGAAVAVYPTSRGKQQQHLCSSQPTLTFGDSSWMWVTAFWNNTRRKPLET